MEVSQMSQRSTEQPQLSGAAFQKDYPGEAHVQCDQCGAAVDDQQRYCIACGAHLKHAYDPAARYFSQVGARARTSRAGSAPQRSASHARGVGLALVLALIPVAAAIGVLAGRSSNNQDSQLIQALARRQGAVTIAGTGSQPTHAAARRARRARATSSHHARSNRPSKAVSTTRYGSVGQISGFRATKTEEQQGASVTQQVQKSTGKSYVNRQSNLPSQVVVP
jgi:hypothetical protein